MTNIRTIRRTLSLVRDVKRHLEDWLSVRDAVTKSLALFVWCRDDPEEAPSLEYLASRTQEAVQRESLDERRPDVDQAGWRTLIGVYGYAWTDDLDLALIEGVRDGHFDPGRLKSGAKEVKAKAARSLASDEWQRAWRRFQDSFADDADAVIENMRTAFLSIVDNLRLGDLVGTVLLFRQLGRPAIATELIGAFVESRRGAPESFDPDADPFAAIVEDEEILEAFRVARASMPAPQRLQEILETKGDYWSPVTIDRLARASVDEFRLVFKSTSGDALRQVLANALRFANVVNATPAMQQVTERARAALLAIAEESPINALRVTKLGIRAPKAYQDQV